MLTRKPIRMLVLCSAFAATAPALAGDDFHAAGANAMGRAVVAHPDDNTNLSVNPGALLFGTDLPSTRARQPFRDEDVDLVEGLLTTEFAEMVFHSNAVSLYRPGG